MPTKFVNEADGSDSDDGTTLALAWDTVSKAVLTVSAGDTVRIVGGGNAYSENTSGIHGRMHFITNFVSTTTFEAYDTAVLPAIQGDGTLTTVGNTMQGGN